ncbi:hypothetical protein HI113_03810 [Corallococcus exiguus]|uniref:Ig-like domain-containing protein n=1 Tax=Corallococcus exiguus TaxID=83462 RepID=UPI001476373E|nr:Ig-like domain-containing protein [Corallococcus exiguus]NNB93036.1 hypothetical protein [Corallococcus exiguus]
MPSEQCKKNVASEPKPDNVLCTDDFCAQIQSNIDSHCTKRNLNPDEPFGSLDPNLHGPGKGGFCYCCCSCFAYDTPIEAAPGHYVLAQDIQVGDEILTAGLDLKWVPKKVQISSGWAPKTPVPSMYHVRYEYVEGEEAYRDLIVTADHLFLLANGDLQVVQKLVAGDEPDILRRADGKEAKVLHVSWGTLASGVHSLQMGEYDGKSLDGHLLNSNGVVTADYAVQLYHVHRSPQARSSEGEQLEVGTPEYHERYSSKAYDDFVTNPESWPAGFTPLQRRELNPPPDAHSFFTRAQALDVKRHAPASGQNNTFKAQPVLYLFNLARAFYPRTTLLLDWSNPLPNAYSWWEWGQQIIVITGGLARIEGLDREGLSLILATQLAYNESKVQCVGPADYDGMSFVMRQLWDSNLFFVTVKPALEQVKRLFGFVSPKHSGENPKNICAQPSLECRLQTYAAALSAFDIPECALPKADNFEVTQARASQQLDSVTITFSEPVNPPTAETMTNYVIQPGPQVTGAKVSREDARQVILTVTGLAAASRYMLTVTDVVSQNDVPLTPDKDTVIFRTA